MTDRRALASTGGRLAARHENTVGSGVWIVACALAVAGLLVAERRGSQRGKWIAKPLASLAFVGVAVAAHALESTYGQLVTLGLVLCLAGDVLLIPEDRPKVFRAGVFAFLAGHVAYAAAFLTQPLSAAGLVVAAAALAVALGLTWRWLAPSLPQDMRASVATYFVVIGAMSTLACGLSAAGGPLIVAIGALAFAASDVSVARDRFVCKAFVNRAWGLPTYYCAQWLLALSAGAYAP